MLAFTEYPTEETYQDTSKERRVWIDIYSPDLLFQPCLSAPPVPIRDEEELLLREVLQPRQQLRRALGLASLPRGESGTHAACIRDILTQGQTPIDGNGLACGIGNIVCMVLVYEALGFGFKGFDCGIVPPIRIVTRLVVVTTHRIEG